MLLVAFQLCAVGGNMLRPPYLHSYHTSLVHHVKQREAMLVHGPLLALDPRCALVHEGSLLIELALSVPSEIALSWLALSVPIGLALSVPSGGRSRRCGIPMGAIVAPHLAHLLRRVLSSSVMPATMPPHPATVAFSRRGGGRDPGTRLPTRDFMAIGINIEHVDACRLIAQQRHATRRRPTETCHKEHLSRHCHKTPPQLERGSLDL